MTKYTRVKMKLECGEVIEWENVAYDETGTHSIFIMDGKVFSVITSKIIWTLFTN